MDNLRDKKLLKNGMKHSPAFQGTMKLILLPMMTLFLVFLGKKCCLDNVFEIIGFSSVYLMYCDLSSLKNFWLLLTYSCFDWYSSTNTSFAQPSGLSLSQGNLWQQFNWTRVNINVIHNNKCFTWFCMIRSK